MDVIVLKILITSLLILAVTLGIIKLTRNGVAYPVAVVLGGTVFISAVSSFVSCIVYIWVV